MYKVMIVDDMEIARIQMKRLKIWGEKSGFIISEEAQNGHEALIKLEKNPVDIVITDIKMPKIDGIELLRNIVERDLCSCVVLLSDFSEFSYARQGIILGAFDYMAKPINELELSSLLKRANEFMTNKRLEIERVRKLEETLDEKTDMPYQAADFARIIELIQSRDMKAIDATARIIDRIGANLNYDVVRIETALNSGIPEIVESLLQNNPWLEKFINIVNLKNLDFFQYKDFESVKSCSINKVQKIIMILNTLQYGVEEKGIVWQVCNCVLENVDNELSLKVIADKLYMNRTYISEVFKQKTGISFIEYLTKVKMERAKILISIDNLKSYEVAGILGYKDVEYFSKTFKKYTSMSPTEFRNS